MSYASFTKSFPQKLFQPTGIAVMASIGIHAIVGATLPYWSSASNEKSQPLRNVRLMQLSPTEQSRLPQVAPPLPLPNQLQSLYPLPPSPSTPLPSLSSKDLPPYFSPLDPLSSLGNYSMPSQPQSPQRQQTNLSQLSISESPVRIQPLALTPLPPAPSTPYPPLTSSRLSGPITPLPTVPITGLSLSPRLPQMPVNPGTLPSSMTLTPEPVPPALYKSDQGLGQVGQVGQFSSVNPRFAGANSIGSISRSLTQSPIITPIPSTRGTIQARTTPLDLGNATSNSNPNVYDPYNKKIVNLLAQNLTDSEQHNLKTLPPISGNCPPNACSAGVNYEVVVKVNVDKGNIISSKVVSSSARDGVFDNVALSVIRGYPLPATDKAQTYLIPVLFKNDSTAPGSLTLPSAPTQTPILPKLQNAPQVQTTPTPQNSAKPQVSPTPQNAPQVQTTPTPQNSTKPQISPTPQNSAKPQTTPEPQNSAKPQTLPERTDSAKPQTTPEPQNSAKPQSLIESTDSTKPQRLPEPPNLPKR